MIFISYSVGRKIVTKRHDKDDDDGDTDMEDITSQYKNPEGNLKFYPVTDRTESFIWNFYDLLTVHLSIILVINQLNAHILVL